MEASDNKKVYEMNWASILLILIFLGGGIFFGIRSARLSKSDQKHIAEQAVLIAQRDSIAKQVVVYAEKVKVLEAKVQQANKNTSVTEANVAMYRRKYLELKNQVPPSPCDTFPVLTGCETQLRYADNFIAILKANVLSYSRLSDTLQLENTFLLREKSISDVLLSKQKESLYTTQNKLRRSKALNWITSGVAAGMLVFLIAQ